MKREGKAPASAILPVPRSKGEAKRFYDRFARWYDYSGILILQTSSFHPLPVSQGRSQGMVSRGTSCK